MYFGGLHSRLGFLYDCDCEGCKTERINLAAENKADEFKSVLKAAENAFKHLHSKGSYKPEDLDDEPYQKLIDETRKVFDSAILDNDIPEAMLAKLQNDTFIFSGLKTHAQLTEATTLLRDDSGKIRSFESFSHEFNKLNENYNQNYLQAEYQFAVSSSQSAGNWANLDNSGRYLLQYRTANDSHVRDSHRQLHDITLPKEDDFWLSYYPPNGWRCRCTAVEVSRRRYEESNPETAIKLGESATSQIGKDGKNKLQIFRFNPGAEQKVFPPKHPYNKVKGAEGVRKIIEKPLKTTKDLSNHFQTFAKENKEFFHRGFKEIKITRSKTANGYTDMNGSIALRSEIADLSKEAINNIRAGKPTTLAQEKALSTLHHELWHNANKPGNMRMTKDQTKTMELANEFVSRKTLPAFMEKLGGKLQNKELTEYRDNTGYNRMVVNYDKLIKWAGAKEKKVVEDVKKSLVEEKYTDQMKGLVSAVSTNSKYDIGDNNIRALISYAKSYSNEKFEKLLEANAKLRKDR